LEGAICNKYDLIEFKGYRKEPGTTFTGNKGCMVLRNSVEGVLDLEMQFTMKWKCDEKENAIDIKVDITVRINLMKAIQYTLI